MENEQLEKILIVEDNPEHLEDARRKMQGIVSVEVDYATNLNEALQYLSDNNYDGIISDVFFPISLKDIRDEEKIEEIYSIIKEPILRIKELIPDFSEEDIEEEIFNWEERFHPILNSWRYGEEIPPSGVYLLKQALKEDIPLVFCTSEFHHGERLEPIHQYMTWTWKKLDGNSTKTRMVDCEPLDIGDRSTFDDIGNVKDWNRAYGLLKRT